MITEKQKKHIVYAAIIFGIVLIYLAIKYKI